MHHMTKNLIFLSLLIQEAAGTCSYLKKGTMNFNYLIEFILAVTV